MTSRLPPARLPTPLPASSPLERSTRRPARAPATSRAPPRRSTPPNERVQPRPISPARALSGRSRAAPSDGEGTCVRLVSDVREERRSKTDEAGEIGPSDTESRYAAEAEAEAEAKPKPRPTPRGRLGRRSPLSAAPPLHHPREGHAERPVEPPGWGRARRRPPGDGDRDGDERANAFRNALRRRRRRQTRRSRGGARSRGSAFRRPPLAQPSRPSPSPSRRTTPRSAASGRYVPPRATPA